MLIPVVFLLRRKSIVTVLLDSGNIVIKDRKKHIYFRFQVYELLVGNQQIFDFAIV